MWNSTFEPGLTQKSKRTRETWPWAETHLLLILSDLFFTVVRNAIIANPGLNFNPRSCFCFSEVYSLAVLILASHLEVTRTWNYMKEYTKLSLLCKRSNLNSNLALSLLWTTADTYPFSILRSNLRDLLWLKSHNGSHSTWWKGTLKKKNKRTTPLNI